MRTVAEHRARALSGLLPLEPRELDLLAAAGCVLAADVVALGPLPAFDASAMDGYAVRLADLATLSHPGEGTDAGGRVCLPVLADLAAGVRRVEPLAVGTAARIMTGAPVPPGADAIVPVEWTDGWAPADGSGTVSISRAPEPGQHVRAAGEGVRAGELLLRAGTVVGPRQIALLAATGRGSILVHPRPRVAVLSTGDELVEAGTPIGFGQVADANSLSLTAAARAAGVDAVRLGHVEDDTEALLTALHEAAAGADVVLTSGGVSAGAYDVVKEALVAAGGVEFTKVAMQPGMPQGFGSIDGVPLFTLPGNPVSAWLSFEVFVRPVLARLRGLPDDHPDAALATITARAGESWTSPVEKLQFTRAVLEPAEMAEESGGGGGGGAGAGGAGVSGRLPSVRPAGGPGSHLVADLALATALALVPVGVARVAVGDVLTCLVLDAGPLGRTS